MVCTQIYTVLKFIFSYGFCVFLVKGIFVCFCVSPDHFGPVLLVSFVGFTFSQYRAKRLAGKNVSED